MEKYTKIKMIGEGSFGKAILVKRKEDNRKCVIKEVNISKMSAKEKEDSRKEVKFLSQLQHPNIVTYLESFEGHGNLFIVMDYCEGGDLYQLIQSQRGINMDESVVLDIFVQCCLAVKHIHDRKILHRDIKTQNIFLTKNRIVKLGDFGIARILKSTMELARTCIGTPYYLSPEIVENRPYNNKSDIWSLGCVLYEMATLKHAFEAGNMKALVMKIVRAQTDNICLALVLFPPETVYRPTYYALHRACVHIQAINRLMGPMLENPGGSFRIAKKKSLLSVSKGSYPPLPNKYSYELRALVAHCFKRTPSDRPSITTILKKPIIQQRISKFLTPEKLEEEFSHTVLHKQKFGQPLGNINNIPQVKPHIVKPKRISPYEKKDPSAVYGVSIAKAPVRSKMKPKNSDAKAPKASVQAKNDLAARERRRKDIAAQEKEYQDYMKKLHNERWEKQQKAVMNRAREAGWKNVLSASEEIKAEQKKSDGKIAPEPNEQKQVTIASDEKPKFGVLQNMKGKPKENWKQQLIAQSIDDSDRANVLEEFWQRKKEAASNKARGNQEYVSNAFQQQESPLLQFHQNEMARQGKNADRPPAYPHGGAARNKQEVEYLKQLENIRKQNYLERKAMNDVRNAPAFSHGYNAPGHLYQAKQDDRHRGDPRYDPEARMRKIEALKVQAEERAKVLREQLEKRRKVAALRLEKERRERIAKLKNEEKFTDELPIKSSESAKEKPKMQGAVIKPSVGLDTAINQIAAQPPKLFRSCSEGDLQKLVDPVSRHNRRNWSKNIPKAPFEFADLPMEITSSAMEATRVVEEDQGTTSISPIERSVANRKKWGNDGKTQFVNMLHNVDLSETNIYTLQKANDTYIKETTKSKNPNIDSPQDINKLSDIGKTITIDKEKNDKVNANVGQTITMRKSPELAKKGNDLTPSENHQKNASSNSKNCSSLLLEDIKSEISLVDNVSTNTEEVESKRSDRLSNVHYTISHDEKINDSDEIEEIPLEQSLARKNIGNGSTEINKEKNSKTIAWDAVEAKQVISPASARIDADSDEQSFCTPSRSLGLQTGSYDVEKKLLRTCSLPDFRAIAEESSDDNDEGDNGSISTDDPVACKFSNGVKKEAAQKADQNSLKGKEENINPSTNKVTGNVAGSNKDGSKGDYGDVDNDTNEDNKIDEEDNEDESGNDDEDDFDEVEIEDVEESEDYESMLESMRGVLNSTAHSPTPGETGKNDGRAKETLINNFLNENEEWESDDENSENRKENIEDTHGKQNDDKLKDTLFSRIEESRQALEEELGFDMFMKIYKHVQLIQENEEDNALEMGTAEISDLLGEKEHLYQKILYLVMADSAYCEGNDGVE